MTAQPTDGRVSSNVRTVPSEPGTVEPGLEWSRAEGRAADLIRVFAPYLSGYGVTALGRGIGNAVGMALAAQG